LSKLGLACFWIKPDGKKTAGEERIIDSATPIYRIGEIRGFEHLPAASPDAAVLASLAPDLPPAEPAQLEPIYLKPPHITLPRSARP
jgi:hypothetical protein